MSRLSDTPCPKKTTSPTYDGVLVKSGDFLNSFAAVKAVKFPIKPIYISQHTVGMLLHYLCIYVGHTTIVCRLIIKSV